MSKWDRYCRVCGAKALYIVTTSPVTGPRAVTAMKLGGGKYCLAHAKERAAEVLAGWEQRQEEKRAAARTSHEIWLASYNKAQEAK
jgi:hypothetical protein